MLWRRCRSCGGVGAGLVEAGLQQCRHCILVQELFDFEASFEEALRETRLFRPPVSQKPEVRQGSAERPARFLCGHSDWLSFLMIGVFAAEAAGYC